MSSALAAESGTPFVEVVSFKTKPKISVAALTDAMKHVDVYLAKEPGLLSRQFLVDANGEGLWIIFWRSEADRDRCNSQEAVGEEAAATETLTALLSEKSVSVKTYRAPLGVLAGTAK